MDRFREGPLNITLSVFGRLLHARFVVAATTFLLLSVLFLGIATKTFAQAAQFDSTADLPSSVNEGLTASAKFTGSNLGNVTVTGVTFRAALPTPTGIVWAVGSATGSCNMGSPNPGGTQVLNCDFGDLPAGMSVQVTVTTTPTILVMCQTLVFQYQFATTNAGIGIGGNPSSSVNCPALAVTKSADAASVAGGDPIGFTIGVTNKADASEAANNVVLTDSLPVTGADWTITSDSSNSCLISGFSVGGIVVDSLQCQVGNLAVGASATIHVALHSHRLRTIFQYRYGIGR